MSALSFPRISRRFIRVWQRNFTVYQKTWKISFIPPMLEPLFYLLAFGYGLSAFIGDIPYGGGRVPYLDFIAPALLAVTIMYNAFFENTYASFVRMYHQKTFDAMLATPLSLEEIIIAEIVWSASKAAGAAIVMVTVLGIFGYVRFPSGLLLIPTAFLGGLSFGAIGLFFTGITPSIEMFNLPIFLFVTPMFLFSGTFFPLSNLPVWAQPLGLVFPLYHLVELARRFALGVHVTSTILSIAYLTVFFIIFSALALATMRKRLIK